MKAAITAIAKSIRERRCLLFLGSGLSAEAGLPSAAKLAGILSQELPSPPSSNHLRSLAQEYANVHSLRSLRKLLQNEIQIALESANIDRRTFEILATLPPVDFITTNWDTLLEDSYRQTAVRTIFLDEEVLFWSLDKINILKMHGCVRSPSSLIATERDYQTYEEDHPHFVRKIGSLLSERTLVLCGYSLEDTTFRTIYREATHDLSLAGQQIYWVDPYARDTYVDEWRAFNVKFLPSTARDFFEYVTRSLDHKKSESVALDGNPIKELFGTARKLLELEKTFYIIEEEEIGEYEFFREKINRASILLERFAGEALGLVAELDRTHLEQLEKYSRSLREMPVRIEKSLHEHSRNLKVPNPKSIDILLKDLVESSAGPLSRMDREIFRRKEILSGEPFAAVERQGPTKEFRETLLSLSRKSGLAEFSEFLAILIERSDEIADYLLESKPQDRLRRKILERLWRHFDIVLLNEKFSKRYRRSRLLRAILASRDEDLVRKVSLVLATSSKQAGKLRRLELGQLEKKIVQVSRDDFDRDVIYRALTLHLYSEEVRRFAIGSATSESLWTLISMERYPVVALCDVASFLLEADKYDAGKLLLDVKVGDLMKLLESEEPVAGSVADVGRFLLMFRSNPVLLLDEYNKKFVNVLRATALRGDGLQTSEFRELYEGLEGGRGDLMVAGPPGERSFRKLPKYAKARLAENMLYLKYFATSEDDEVALLVGPTIKDSKLAALLLQSRRINPALLRWLAKRKPLMASYAAKRALLFNPKVQTEVARQYLGRLRPHDVELLSRSHDVNPAVRQLALAQARRRG